MCSVSAELRLSRGAPDLAIAAGSHALGVCAELTHLPPGTLSTDPSSRLLAMDGITDAMFVGTFVETRTYV